MLTSPFTWLEDYTEKGKWIGGREVEGGGKLRCADALKQTLDAMGYDVCEVQAPPHPRHTLSRCAGVDRSCAGWPTPASPPILTSVPVLRCPARAAAQEGKIPLVIRETVRKYQFILAHKLVARKRL